MYIILNENNAHLDMAGWLEHRNVYWFELDGIESLKKSFGDTKMFYGY